MSKIISTPTLTPDELSNRIWAQKYKHSSDTCWEDTCYRIWRMYAETRKRTDNKDAVLDMLIKKRFLPGGRIINNYGTTKGKATCFNCFVMENIQDSMEGIFETLSQAALTQKQGGGVGFNFSTIRPRGTFVQGVESKASGPVSFMDIFDTTCKSIVGGGCLAGDTKVYTDRGFLPIETIVKNRLPVKVKTEDGWKAVTAYFDNGVKPVHKVVFEDGNTIVCTDLHKFHSVTTDGEIKKQELRDLKVGDTCFFATAPLSVTANEATVKAGLSYVLGHYWANGYTRSTDCSAGDYRVDHVSITFSRQVEGIACRTLCEKILTDNGFTWSITTDNEECDTLNLHGDHSQRFADLAGVKGKSSDIRFPANVTVMPFIAGYFDGDGSWKSATKGPEFCSISQDMLEMVKHHLMMAGIPSHIEIEHRKSNTCNTMYRLHIAGVTWQERFANALSPWLHKIGKKAHPRSVRNTYPASVLKQIPHKSEDLRGKICKSHRVGYHNMQECFPNTEYLKFGPMQIESITSVGEQSVYDLEVEDTHSYVAEGVLVSNSRRGAQMAVLNIDHPDIEEFIDAKLTPGRLTQFNLSIGVSDAFMETLARKGDWALQFNGQVYRHVKATDLWNKVMTNTYNRAEPGVLFLDRINNENNLKYIEKIHATNPCGEQPLPENGACLLGSFNLPAYYRGPNTAVYTAFTAIHVPEFDFAQFEKDIARAVDLLDTVIDNSSFPLEAQQAEALNKRRMGIGITGLADLLVLMRVKYSSKEGRSIASQILKVLSNHAYQASTRLAAAYGAFPAFVKDQYMKSPYIQRLSPQTQSMIAENGIRNSHLISLAPTGTISLLAGNVSSGIEPIFAESYTRKFVTDGDIKEEFIVQDYAYAKLMSVDPNFNKEILETALNLSPASHLDMLKACAPYVDSAISKTINVPEETSFEDFAELYTTAYSMGLKGITTYRPNNAVDSVLSVKKDKKEEVVAEDVNVIPERPEVLPGNTYRIQDSGGISYYLTINDVVDGDITRPFEIFINSKNIKQATAMVTMTRLLSAIFRKEKDPSFIIDELKSIVDPEGGYFSNGQYINSIQHAIALVLETHLNALKQKGSFKGKKGLKKVGTVSAPVTQPVQTTRKDLCPQCSAPLQRKEGCLSCLTCGYSKCG